MSRMRWRSLVERIARLPLDARIMLLADIGDDHLHALAGRWEAWAEEGQYPPEGDWRLWLIRAGRGFGKTRAGAEWISGVARATPDARIALVGGTIEDVRKVMIEGRSGLIATTPAGQGYIWRRDVGEFTFPSGATAFIYSAEAPEKLRGPEHHAAWCDELAKWRYGDAAWDNLMLGLRLGDNPRAIVTTTPKSTPLMHRVMAMKGVTETRGSTVDNPHLPPAFVAAMIELYGGTRLGRQELDGELVEDAEGALWTQAMIEACRVAAAPDLVRVVVAVDPPASATGDECGIVAAGVAADGMVYVLEDASGGGLSPERWAARVAECARRHEADRVVAEVNQGGDMVASVLAAADARLPVRMVRASRGKVARAEPIAAAYERGRVKHAARLDTLEAQLRGLLTGGGYAGPGRSPDRADALVWAVTALLPKRARQVGVRGLWG